MMREAGEERPVSRSEPKTEVHSSNGRLLVTTAVRSGGRRAPEVLKRSKYLE
jgi:hypothetical protein